jgi:kynureninase
MRFGFTPLFIESGDVDRAVAIIADVMGNRLWDRPEYRTRAKVT